jgi:hypothetical protein
MSKNVKFKAGPLTIALGWLLGGVSLLFIGFALSLLIKTLLGAAAAVLMLTGWVLGECILIVAYIHWQETAKISFWRYIRNSIIVEVEEEEKV